MAERSDLNSSSESEGDEAGPSNALLAHQKQNAPEERRAAGSSSNEKGQCSLRYPEPKPFPPKLSRLRHILQDSLYKGEAFEHRFVRKYTLPDLMSITQASEGEVMFELEILHACDIDGFIRVIDYNYEFLGLSLICGMSAAAHYPWNKIPKKVVVDFNDDVVHRNVLEQCFTWYGYRTGEVDGKGQELYCLREYDICRVYAEVLLKQKNVTTMDLVEFYNEWNNSLPNGMKPDLDQLQGLVMVDLHAESPIITYFPRRDLPYDVPDRFSSLFEKKNTWTYDEIEPYLRDVAVRNNKDIKVLLAKYAKACTNMSGQTIYISK